MSASLGKHEVAGEARPGTDAAGLFALMADALPVCIAHVGPDQCYRFANATYQQWFGLAPAEIVGRSVREILGERAYAAVRPKIESALRGEAESFEYLAEYRRGETREVRVSYVPLQTPAGTDGFIALIDDVTARNTAERRVHEMLECFRAVTLAAFEGIAISEHGCYVEVNEPYARRLGYSPPELIGRSVMEHVSSQSRPQVMTALDTRFQGTYEIMARHRDGTPFPVEVCAVNLDVGGRRLRITAARDVSARYAVERAVAEISHREQTRIGHDLHDSLSQEMAGLALGLENLRQRLAARGAGEAVQLEQLLQVLKRSIRNAKALAHGLAPVLESHGGLAAAIARLAEDTRQLQGAEVVCDCRDTELLDSATATHVYRVVQEALSNALRHGDARRVGVATAATGNQFALTVTDDGCGFVPGPGTAGLGMQTMRYRARLLGGNCTVGAGEGGGTRVCLSFPLLPDAAA